MFDDITATITVALHDTAMAALAFVADVTTVWPLGLLFDDDRGSSNEEVPDTGASSTEAPSAIDSPVDESGSFGPFERKASGWLVGLTKSWF